MHIGNSFFQKRNNTFFNGSNVIPNYSCTGCAFNTSGANPKVIGELNNNSTITEWNVTAGGMLNSTWDLFVRFNYSSTSSPTDAKTIKTRGITDRDGNTFT